jgi:integrase
MILTAMRTSEVLFEKWSEFVLDDKVWIVPAERMKMKEEHRVPLSQRCIEILQQARQVSGGGEYVFPNRQGKQLSTMVFLMALRRMGQVCRCSAGQKSCGDARISVARPL